LLIPLFACWGSFLNVLGFRLIRDQSIVWPRSACPSCGHTLAWYDLIPIFSWLFLRAKCRYCALPISCLYPLIELLTVCSLTGLYLLVPGKYFFAYGIFFSALIVTIRSDLEAMLISRYATIFLIPGNLILSACGFLPLTPVESISAALIGYLLLCIPSYLFLWLTGKEGIGQGDLELLAFIGSCIGLFGCWFSLLCGSIFGSLVGLGYLVTTQSNRSTKIPFGPFLAFGAMSFVLLKPTLEYALAYYQNYWL
jgi:prepilin signal peptidase PulO-like enzyme (type II secretory pathway)